MKQWLLLAIVCAAACAGASCNQDYYPYGYPGGTGPTAPSTTPAPPGPGTDSVTAQMAPGGSVIHTFVTVGVGAVNVTLTGTDPGGTLVGMGVGVPGANFGGCDMTKTIQARQGTAPQLTVTVEAGTYCAGTYDVGGVGANGVLVNFTVQHP